MRLRHLLSYVNGKRIVIIGGTTGGLLGARHSFTVPARRSL
jgi:hypothetical protein